MKPLLVGEDNPYGSDPRYALYAEPEGSAGWRLCCVVMGLSLKEYVRRFDRVNLCSKKWSIGEARFTARKLLAQPREVFVLCGAKVAKAFDQWGGGRGLGFVSEPYVPFRVTNAPYVVPTTDHSGRLIIEGNVDLQRCACAHMSYDHIGRTGSCTDVSCDCAVYRQSRIATLPHPSGRCRTWNEPGSIYRARAVLGQVGALSASVEALQTARGK